MLIKALLTTLWGVSVVSAAALANQKLGPNESWVVLPSDAPSGARVAAAADKPAPVKNSHTLQDDFTDPAKSANSTLPSADRVGLNACPNYFQQTITVPVYIRYYYYAATAAELSGKIPSYYGYHTKQEAARFVDRMNVAYSAWNPRIRFQLATGNTKETAGVWYWRFPTMQGFLNQKVGLADRAAERAIALQNRGTISQRPTNQNNQLWVYSVNNIEGGIPAFSFRPTSSSSFSEDGVWYRTEYFEAPSSYNTYYQPSTASHMAGHWLGLRHTYEGGCAATTATTGDMCVQTPPWSATDAPISCPRFGASYASQKNPCRPNGPTSEVETGIRNFMSASYPGCRDKFTADQMGITWRTATAFRKLPAGCFLPAK